MTRKKGVAKSDKDSDSTEGASKFCTDDDFAEEPCGCGKCEKSVSASAAHLLCFSCQCPVLAVCLGLSTAFHSYLTKSANFLFVCDSCKCESVPASAELRELKAKVDKMAEVLCPEIPAAHAQEHSAEFDESASNATDDPWTVAGPKKHHKQSYAQATAGKNPFCLAVAKSVSRVMEDRDKEELQRRTIVIENCCPDPDKDDMRLAVDLCAHIHPNISVLGVHRMKPPFQQKPQQKSQAASSLKTGKSTRPPILKVFLRSSMDKSLALCNKSKLQYGEDWMNNASVRPSLPFEERQRRNQLLEVARARNGKDVPKTDRFLVWLNPRSEKYEFRQVKEGEWVQFSEVKKLTEAELSAAKAAIEKKQKEKRDEGQRAEASGKERSGGRPKNGQ